MKKLVLLFACVLLIRCAQEAAGDPPLTISCKPVVTVTIPSTGSAAAKAKPPAPRPERREAAQVYWDVSSSMRVFAATKPAKVSSKKGQPQWTDALTPVVVGLDVALLRAHAAVVEHYGVGETIAPIASARAALSPKAKRTALHLAAEQIGSALAGGGTQAALLISDLELDTPPRNASSGLTVCGGVPLPSTAEAGPLFGRCFENAVLLSGAAAHTRRNLLVHVFRKSTNGRELFILLLATDRKFGLRISDEIGQRLDFSKHVIFDSGSVSAASVQGCRAILPPGAVPRTREGCGTKCFEAGVVQTECDVRRPVSDAWIYPVGGGTDGVRYESLKTKPGATEDQAVTRFTIPCGAKAGRFTSTVAFSWKHRAAADAAFAQRASVRDLFDSLSDAIVRTAAPRRLNIAFDLSK